MEDKYFQKRLLLHQRTTLAYLTDKSTVRLQTGSVKNIYTYEFSNTGEKLEAFSNAFNHMVDFNSFYLCFAPQNPVKKYYEEHDTKKKYYYGSTSSKRSLLVEFGEKTKPSILQW